MVGAYVEMHDPENCECTEEDGLARTLVFEPFRREVVSELKLARYYLQIFKINDK